MDPRSTPVGYKKKTASEQETISALFLSIALVLVSLRFYVRIWIVKRLWWDDFFLLLGSLFAVAAFGVAIAAIKSGFGQHAYSLLPQQVYFTMKMGYIGVLLVLFSFMFTRISICLFLLRIFTTTNRVWKRAMFIILALIVATNLSTAILLIISQCKPMAKWWNPTINGTCWQLETKIRISYYQGGVSIFIDFLLAFLPTYFLKDVKISFRTKMSICALMSLGVFSGICAIIRTTQTSTLINYRDYTYFTKKFNIWAGLELYVAIIAAALPAVRPLWPGSAIQTQKKRGQAGQPDHKQPPSRPYVMMNQPVEVDSLPSGLETRISTHGGLYRGDVGSETAFLPDHTGIMKTSDISMSNFRQSEGKWVPEHPSLSNGERSAEDVV